VFLTDGYIGNEAEILGALQQTLGGARVFSMGVGSSPNRYLMEHMAKLGRGAVAYLGLNDRPEETMAEYFGAISHPAMTDLSIDFGSGAEAVEVYPKRLPDLFVGRPVTVVGLMRGETPQSVKVRGKVRGEERALEVAVSRGAGSTAQGAAVPVALPAVWARMRIADLGNHLARNPGDAGAVSQVRRVALEYGLLSAYTSFVAVDSMTRTAGEYGTTVVTPVPVPEGTRYETSVNEGR
jgi:Ca-activated chloride channel family protein